MNEEKSYKESHHRHKRTIESQNNTKHGEKNYICHQITLFWLCELKTRIKVQQTKTQQTTATENEHPIQQAHLTADIIENKQQPAKLHVVLCKKS